MKICSWNFKERSLFQRHPNRNKRYQTSQSTPNRQLRLSSGVINYPSRTASSPKKNNSKKNRKKTSHFKKKIEWLKNKIKKGKRGVEPLLGILQIPAFPLRRHCRALRASLRHTLRASQCASVCPRGAGRAL